MRRIRNAGLGLALLWPCALRADGLSDAYSAFEKGQYEEAAKGFQNQAHKDPQDFDQLYNSGVSLYRKGDYAEASNYFDRAKQAPDPQLKSRAAYNKGVAMGRMGRWDQAEAEFQEALSYDNDNKMIQENLQQASLMKKMQKNQPQNQDSQQQANQSQNQNGQQQANQSQNQNGQQQAGDQHQKDPNGDKSMPDPTKDAANKQQQAGGSQDPQQGAAGQQQAQTSPSKDGRPSMQKDPNGKDGLQDDKGKDRLVQQKDGKDKLPDGKDQKGQAFAPQKDDSNPDGTMQLADPKGGAPGAEEGHRVLTVKDLKKQEAEKILRSVDDRIGTYVLTPEQANTEGKSRNGKDW